MESIFRLVLAHPERFTRAEIPCCLWTFIDPDLTPDIPQPLSPWIDRSDGYSGALACSAPAPSAGSTYDRGAIGSAEPGIQPLAFSRNLEVHRLSDLRSPLRMRSACIKRLSPDRN